jgi:hypothetical protein
MNETKIQEKINVISFHSVKGGVGKTSLAIAAAAILGKQSKKTLLVDADITGTSLMDVFSDENLNKSCDFYNYLFATPDEHLTFLKHKVSVGNKKFKFPKMPGTDNVYILPGETLLERVRLAVSYLSQEFHLHYFRERLVDLVGWAFNNKFEYVIFDFPPGLFGLSTAGIHASEGSQLTSNFFRSENELIWQKVFVSSSEKVDYLRLYQTLCELIEENPSGNAGKKEIYARFNISFNKIQLDKKHDPAETLANIKKNLCVFNEAYDKDPAKLMLDRFDSSLRNNNIMPFIENFSMEDIVIKVDPANAKPIFNNDNDQEWHQWIECFKNLIDESS